MSEYIVNLEGELGMALAVACAGAGFAREEIVRCRDCEWFSSAGSEHNDGAVDWCLYHGEVEPDGFCAWGERKVDE